MFRVNLFEYQQECADIQTQAIPPLLRWLKWTVKMNIFCLRNSIPFISCEMMQMAALIHLWHEYSAWPQAAAPLLQDVSSLCVCVASPPFIREQQETRRGHSSRLAWAEWKTTKLSRLVTSVCVGGVCAAQRAEMRDRDTTATFLYVITVCSA